VVINTFSVFAHFHRDQPKIDDTARHVFTDVSVKLAIEEVCYICTPLFEFISNWQSD